MAQAKGNPSGSSMDLARLLGITDRRVRQLTNEGVIKRRPEGDYDLTQSIQAYYEFKLMPDEEVDYNIEKALHERAKRELAELELARQRGKVHAASDVEAVMTDMLTNLRSNLLALPTKLAGTLAQRDQAYIAGVLEAEIEDRLTELSDYSPELFTPDGAIINEEEDD